MASSDSFSCCPCCVVADDAGACAFNRRRDNHVSPCDVCEADAYKLWEAEHPPNRGALDVPF